MSSRRALSAGAASSFDPMESPYPWFASGFVGSNFGESAEDCTGWDLQRMQKLMDQVNKRWDEYGNIPSRLPSELLEKHTELYDWATRRARERGWDPELGEDD